MQIYCVIFWSSGLFIAGFYISNTCIIMVRGTALANSWF